MVNGVELKMGVTGNMLGNFFDGDIGEEDRLALAQALETDHEACREFDSAINMEALLTAAHAPEPDYPGIVRTIADRTTVVVPFFRRPLLVAAAALALIAGGALLLYTARGPASHEVLSGQVFADGTRAKSVKDGQRLEVIGGGPAVVALNDGSRVTLTPSSVAVLHGREGAVRQNLKLVNGRGDFKVQSGSRLFKVTTSVGNVTVLGTEFSVELRHAQRQGGEEMKGKIATVMAVAVALGSVEVEVGGKAYVLSAGQNRVFAGEESRAPKTRKVGGTISSQQGNSLTIVQRGDSGEKSYTFGLGNDVKILVETDQWEDRPAEGGRTKKHRVIANGTFGDLAEGRQVTVTVTRGDGRAVSILVRAQKTKREGGEADREPAVRPPRRREGEREREGGEGGEKKERRREGEREGDREGDE